MPSVADAVLRILEDLGVPLGATARQKERQAKALLALMGVRRIVDFPDACSLDTRGLKTREIIEFMNSDLGENLSLGGYDEIRRTDLKMAHLAGIVIQPSGLAKNSPARTWGINPEVIEVFRSYATDEYRHRVAKFVADKGRLIDELAARRELHRVPVTLPGGKEISFAGGEHDLLLQAIIEEFLPIYGYGASVIYVADAEDRGLHYDQSLADGLQLPPIDDGGLLPDVICYSAERGWVYLIEAVHSAGPIDPGKRRQLRERFRDSRSPIVYVTAFADRSTFASFSTAIAWETEVWIASDPEHIIHFNGDRFLGPYED